MALYTRPSDIITAAATWTVTAGATDPRYPVTNLSDLKAHTVAKSTGTTITYRATFSAPQPLAALAFINTNATAIQVTNGAGLIRAAAIPAVPLDGLRLDPWLDLRALTGTSSSQWTVALTGPVGVALAVPLLVTALREIQILFFNPNPVALESHRTILHQTDYGVRLKHPLGVRQRGLRGSILGEQARADILALQRDAAGTARSFLLIEDDDLNDALYVDLTTDLRELVYVAPAANNGYLHSAALEFTEQQKGWL